MIIDKISTRRFARHDAVDIEMPRTGVVLITGKNGHGKSTLAEAVAQGGWNGTLRGAPGWRKGAKSGVEIHFEGGYVRRSVSDSKHVLKWQVDEDGAAEYPTRTKAQAALESHIGTFHVWNHACTFHTDDVARFTNTTDASRKRLLEEVLELDRVEKGYKKLREKMNVARKEATAAKHAVELARAQADSLDQQLQLLSGEQEEHADVEELRKQSRELKQALGDTEATLRQDRGVSMQAQADYREQTAAVTRINRRVQRFETWEDPRCRECEQPVGEEHRESVVADARRELEAAKAEQTAADQAALAASTAEDAAQAAFDNACRQYAQCVEAGKMAVATAARNAERTAKWTALDERHTEATALLDAKREARAAKETEVAELEAAASVLAFTGVRAALLASAVSALEDLANDWLARLGLDGLSVGLSSQSTSKTGAVSDKISFEIEGAGGGYGYKGCSTGERRRIDIAMMFALGELAETSRGVSPNSTLWIDEVFDGLDEEGRDAVVLMLSAISKERCVVVITHNRELTARLSPVLKLHAVEGDLLHG